MFERNVKASRSRELKFLFWILLIGNIVCVGWNVFNIVQSNAGDFLLRFYILALVINVIAVILLVKEIKFGKWEM